MGVYLSRHQEVSAVFHFDISSGYTHHSFLFMHPVSIRLGHDQALTLLCSMIMLLEKHHSLG